MTSVPYTRIVATADGGCRFEEGVEPVALEEFAPPAPAMRVSPVRSSRAVRFIGAPAGWDAVLADASGEGEDGGIATTAKRIRRVLRGG